MDFDELRKRIIEPQENAPPLPSIDFGSLRRQIDEQPVDTGVKLLTDPLASVGRGAASLAQAAVTVANLPQAGMTELFSGGLQKTGLIGDETARRLSSMAGIERLVRGTSVFDTIQKKIEGVQSDKWKEDTAKEFVQEVEKGEGWFGSRWKPGEGLTSPIKIIDMVLQSVPASVAGMGGGVVATKALLGMANAVGKAVMKPAVAGILGAAVGEGSVAGGMAFNQMIREMQGLSDEEVVSSPYFQEKYGQNITPDNIQLARNAMSLTGGLMTGILSAIGVGVLGAPSGAFIGRVISGEAGKTLASTILKSAALEGFQEFTQEPTEQMIENMAVKWLADRNQSFTEGMGEAAVGGFISGAAMGGGLGKMAHTHGIREREAIERAGILSKFTGRPENEIGHTPDEIVSQITEKIMGRNPAPLDLLQEKLVSSYLVNKQGTAHADLYALYDQAIDNALDTFTKEQIDNLLGPYVVAGSGQVSRSVLREIKSTRPDVAELMVERIDQAIQETTDPGQKALLKVRRDDLTRDFEPPPIPEYRPEDMSSSSLAPSGQEGEPLSSEKPDKSAKKQEPAKEIDVESEADLEAVSEEELDKVVNEDLNRKIGKANDRLKAALQKGEYGKADIYGKQLEALYEKQRKLQGRIPAPRIEQVFTPREDVPKEHLPEPKQPKRGSIHVENVGPVEIEYRLADADALVPSNNPLSFHPDKRLPKELQPRNRERLEMRLQVTKMAKNLDPNRLGAAPTPAHGGPLVKNTYVVGGHGRAMAIQQAYELGNAESLRQYYIDHAEDFGYTPEQVKALERPVIYREIVPDEVDLKKIALNTNDPGTAKMSATETAAADTDILTRSLMAAYKPGKEGELNVETNQDFLSRFIQGTGSDAPNLTTADGKINKQGLERIKSALFDKAYGASNELSAMQAEDANPDNRNIIKALGMASGDFARARVIDEGNLTDNTVNHLLEAVKLVRRSRLGAETLQQILNQKGLFDQVSDETKLVAGFLDENIRKPSAMGDFFRHVAERIIKASDKQKGLFGEKDRPRTSGDVIRQAIEAVALDMSVSESGHARESADTKDINGSEMPKKEEGHVQNIKEAEKTPQDTVVSKAASEPGGGPRTVPARTSVRPAEAKKEQEDTVEPEKEAKKSREEEVPQIPTEILRGSGHNVSHVSEPERFDLYNELSELKKLAESYGEKFPRGTGIAINAQIRNLENGAGNIGVFKAIIGEAKEEIRKIELLEKNQVAKTDFQSLKEKPEGLGFQKGTKELADKVANILKDGKNLSWSNLVRLANDAFGGIQANGMWAPKDAYDAMELGINIYIRDHMPAFSEPAEAIEWIETNILSKIPTQTKRSEEQDEFQQFSTPPHLAYVVNWLANPKKGDLVLEPSGGIGGLAVFAGKAGAKVVFNELSQRRLDIARNLKFARYFNENAEQIHNILPADVKPSVVLMNPPFSATAGRIHGQRKTLNTTRHLDQALERLEPGGRLVAIVGKGMQLNKPTFHKWWQKTKSQYNVRAAVRVDGSNYRKYGTTFDNVLIVIDKTGPTSGDIIQGRAENLKDLAEKLKEVHNEVKNGIYEQGMGEGGQAGEKPSFERAGKGDAQETEGTGLRSGDRSAGTSLLAGDGTSGGSPGAPGVVEPARGSGRGVDTGADHLHIANIDDEIPGRYGPDRQRRSADSGESTGKRDDSEDRIHVVEQGTEESRELTDSVFDTYRPAVTVQGAKAHPGKLVESAAMAAVKPAKTDYSPNLPKAAIETGKISDAQLEAVVRAGHNHSKHTPDGQRQGFFVGDGTGVGKGREIAAIIWDNFRQGRKKAVWITKNSGLFKDAKRDIEGIGWDSGIMMELSKTAPGADIKAEEGVLFVTYDTLKGQEKKEGGRTRIEQLKQWLGDDFDGVIAFDEAHLMGNLLQINRTDKVSQRAIVGQSLRNNHPDARVVYFSATGATDPKNLAYLDRLGIWGEGTPFGRAIDFVDNINAGGVAAMELVASDLKAQGKYLARSLSFDDVTYDRVTHKLTKDQRDSYNTYAESWQIVLNNMEEAIGLTDADPKTRAKAMSYFWGANQRFWNQVLTSLQMPSVIKSADKELKAGNSVVFQLVNTNEAQQDRAISQMDESSSVEDLDLTPTEIIFNFVETGFPTQQYEESMDENGNIIKTVVTDSQGNPVQNAQAVAMKEALLDRLAGIKGLDGPLDIILNHFGQENVAEITGRKRRTVWVADEKGRKKIIQKRGKAAVNADAKSFMDGKKRVLVFSDAGGTGFSFHADNNAKNRQKRIHYLVQPGWKADSAIQGLGRTHRTNQASAPRFILASTDVPAQARFISTIARRLDQLGALTRGQRETSSQGLFKARDNLETAHATDALRLFFSDAKSGNIPGINIEDLQKQLGLKLVSEQTGGLLSQLPDMPKFLNRTLSLRLDMMEKVFDAYMDRLDHVLAIADQAGALDAGMETIRGTSIRSLREEVVRRDEETGAETKYHELEIETEINYRPFDQVEHLSRFLKNKRSGQVWVISGPKKHFTDPETGQIKEFYRVESISSARVIGADQVDGSLYEEPKFDPLSKDEARAMWEESIEKAPRTRIRKEHLISGSLLPIWDRLPRGSVKIKRARTDDGAVILGRTIPSDFVESTLKSLGSASSDYNPNQAADQVLQENATIRFANDWRVKRSLVSGEQRFELIGPDNSNLVEMDRLGVFRERIGFKMRFFIPNDKAGQIIGDIAKSRPIVSVTSPSVEDIRYSATSIKPWPKDFPEIYGHTNIAALKRHPDYEKAKAGDVRSALKVVSDLAKIDRIKELGRQFPNAEIVFVHSQEEGGLNKLPVALATAIGDITGLAINTDIIQSNRPEHTKKDAAERILSRAEFDGPVKKGQEYIIVDDVVAQGGTISELKHYIENNGGKVVAVSALSYARGSGKIAIQPETIKTLTERFGKDDLERLLKKYDVAGTIQALTEREGRYLAKFKSLDTIRDRFAQERQSGSHRVLYSLLERESSRVNDRFSGGPEVGEATGAEASLANVPQYPASVESSVKANKLQETVDKIMNRFPGLKKEMIKVFQSESQLPGKLQAVLKKQDMAGKYDAMIWEGKIYLVADNLTKDSVAELSIIEGLLRHEGRHYAIEQIFGNKKARDQFFAQVAERYSSSVHEYLRRHELEDTSENRIIAAEEVIIDRIKAGETGGIIDRFIARIANFLRTLFPKLKISNAEVRELIARADRIIEGKGGVLPIGKFAADTRYLMGGQALATRDGIEKLETAQKMVGGREKIWNETGWWKLGGDWKFEISPENAAIKTDRFKGLIISSIKDVIPEGQKVKKSVRLGDQFKDSGITKTVRLEDIYDYPDLYELFPGAKDIRVAFHFDPRGGAYRDRKNNLISISIGDVKGSDLQAWIKEGSIPVNRFKNKLEHEIQHAIQEIEGFPRGGSPSNVEPAKGFERSEKIYAEAEKIFEAASQESNPEKRALMNKEAVNKMVAADKLARMYAYATLPGEAEARMVQRRLKMTPEERKAEPPWVTLEKMLKEEGLLKEGQRVEDVLVDQRIGKDPATKQLSLPKAEIVSAVRFSRKPTLSREEASSRSSEVQKRFKAAQKGPERPSFGQKAKEFIGQAKDTFTRHFIHLDPKTDGAIIDILRRFQETPAAMWEKAGYHTVKFLKEMDENARDVFTYNLVLGDMVRDIENGTIELERGEQLPFGYKGVDDVYADLDHFRQVAERHPEVKKALEERAKFMGNLRKDLVKHKLLPKAVLKSDPNEYFHHQVLDYMALKKSPGLYSKDLRTKKKGWQFSRTGSLKDYSTNYLESEIEVISQGLVQVKTQETLDRIKKLADIKGRLEKQVYDQNVAALEKAFAEAGSLEDPLKPFKTKIAIGFSGIEKKAARGELLVPDEYQDIVEELAQNYWDKKDKDKDQVEAGQHPKMFQFLSWLINTKSDGAMEAAIIFKAIKNRNRFIKESLGRNFKTYRDLIPEGYAEWKPKPGQAFYFTNSLADKVIEDVLSGHKSLEDTEVQKVLARGRDAVWVIPDRVAATLDDFKPPRIDSLPEKISVGLMSKWKQWILINPYRIVRYNINNMSGDLDISLAYDPKIAKMSFKAAKDLWSAYGKGKWKIDSTLRKELDEAREAGVIGTGMTQMDIPDIGMVNKMDEFMDILDGKPPRGLLQKNKKGLKWYWEQSKGLTNWRENIIRLAAYRYFKEKLEQSGYRNVYAASKVSEIDAMWEAGASKDEIAAKLARELIGDYGNISQGGQWLRHKLIPFWSWCEINAPRYIRLFRNLKHEDRSVTGLGGVMAWKVAKLGLKAGLLFGLVNIWNALMFPDEDDELGEAKRHQMHLILGRREDGTIITLRFQGALSDALSWFGQENPIETYRMLAKGDFAGEATRAVKAPAEKLITGLRPEPKMLFESITGSSLYPDPFSPKPIRDKVQHLLRTFSLDKIYNIAVGKPSRAGSWEKQFVDDLKSMVIYETDPGETAYWEIRKRVFDFRKEKGHEAPTVHPTNKSNALYYYRQAIKYGDLAAAAKYYQKYIEYGGTAKSIADSIKRAHPLSSLPIKDRYAFRNSLSEKDLKTLEVALRWYRDTYLSVTTGQRN